jgi:hypothetical protein
MFYPAAAGDRAYHIFNKKRGLTNRFLFSMRLRDLCRSLSYESIDLYKKKQDV